MHMLHSDIREAVDHLPEGALLVVKGVSWQDYEQFLDDLEDRPGVRVTYDDGKLEIVSPLSEHEEYKRFGLLESARSTSKWTRPPTLSSRSK